MKRLVGALGLAVLAACGSGSESGGSATTAAAPTTATPSATSGAPAPESTLATAPPTTAPVTATTAPVPVTAATTQPPPSTSPSTAPPSESEPTSGTAVVYASSGDDYAWLPVGWWDGADWGSVEWPTPDVVIPASTFETLSVASVELAGPLHGLTDYAPTSYGCLDDAGLGSFELVVDLPDVPDRWGYRALGVMGDWDVQPRSVSAVGVDSPVYQELGESLVPDDQPVDPTSGDVVQVLRADLDGNGVEEVLFTFQHLTDSGGMGAPGEFSLVIARYPDATGAVVDEVLVEHFVPTPMDTPSPDRSRVMAIADLNGDGTMEVAIGSTYWESANVSIYEFADGSLHQVMESGCGV